MTSSYLSLSRLRPKPKPGPMSSAANLHAAFALTTPTLSLWWPQGPERGSVVSSQPSSLPAQWTGAKVSDPLTRNRLEIIVPFCPRESSQTGWDTSLKNVVASPSCSERATRVSCTLKRTRWTSPCQASHPKWRAWSWVRTTRMLWAQGHRSVITLSCFLARWWNGPKRARSAGCESSPPVIFTASALNTSDITKHSNTETCRP